MRLIPMFCLGLRKFARKPVLPKFFLEKHQANEIIDVMNCFTCPCKVSRAFSRKVRTHVVYVHVSGTSKIYNPRGDVGGWMC